MASASRMFGLYTEWFDSEKYSNKANKRKYKYILNANFNIGFHKPKKDLCDVCHTYKNKELPTEEEKTRYLQHQALKKAARRLKQMDKDEAKSNKEVLTATFDFEKVLITPHGDVSVFYYKRKLATLNFTVYNLVTKKVHVLCGMKLSQNVEQMKYPVACISKRTRTDRSESF